MSTQDNTDPNNMSILNELPVNWEARDKSSGLRWYPPVAGPSRSYLPLDSSLSAAETKGVDSPLHPTQKGHSDIVSTMPLLSRWKNFWTENGNFDMGGWTLRDVTGFYNDSSE